MCRGGETAVVLSAEIKPYIEAREGLRTELEGAVSVLSLQANPELVKRQLEEEAFRMVVAVGPEAAELLYAAPRRTTDRMVLMVLDPEKFLGTSPLCGVDMRIPFQAQFQVLAERMGKGLRVGIPFHPQENQAWVDDARQQALVQEFVLLPIPIRSRDEVLPQLTAAYASLDVLLFIPDPVVIAESLVSHIIKDAMKHGVASVGYNSFFFRSGAVLSFNLDYRRIGAMAAGLIRESQGGGACRLLAPPFEVAWNEKAWRLIPAFREAAR